MPAPKRLDYLDGWRVAAILMVFADHFSMNHAIAAFYEKSPLGVVAQYGETGVFIFFFISGYVVSLGCLKEAERTGGFSARAFYIRRFFRIVPPLMLYLTALLALGLGGAIEFGWDDFLSGALYLCNSTAPGVACKWYVGHTWSLAFETQFYWLFPAVFSWLALGKTPRLWPASAALAFAAVPFVFTIWWIGKIGCLIAYSLFFLGYLAARRAGAGWPRLGGWRYPALAGAALIVFMPRSVVASFGADEEMKGALIAWYRLAYIGAIPTLVLLTGAPGTILHGLLSNGVLAWLGRASYSVYLWQQLCNGPVFNDLDVLPQFALMGAMLLFCLCLFPLEQRLVGFGRAAARRRSAEGAQAPGAELAANPAAC
ncbi:MAG: acyltransferase family protein [Methylocystis sp.]|uniref:acyltransferase family protein n=1 Tax=Methylocystis sp. TaxID=1911079 RepID=UPI003DA2332D